MIILKCIFLELVKEKLVRCGEVSPQCLVHLIDDGREFDLIILAACTCRCGSSDFTSF